MSEWQECIVEEIAMPGKNSLSTGPFGSAISSKYFVDTGVPVIRGGNLSTEIGTRIIDDCFVFVTEEKASEFTRSTVREGDIVFTCWGTINQIGLIDKKSKYSEYIISNKQMKLTPDTEKTDSLFLYYLFSSPEKQQEIINNGIGAAVPGFNLGQLRKMVLSLPPLEEQKAIATLLSSLDDKIDLLHRQNKILEAMAEKLFRQWFIEEAKEGWEEMSLLDVVELIGGGTPKTSTPEYWDGEIPWLSGGDIASSHKSFVISSEKTITEDGLNNSSAKLLPKFATVISARGTVGKYALLSKPMTYSESNYGVLPKVDNCYFFTYLLINHVVGELRNTLLPKLMSGEVRVKTSL